MKPFHIMAKPIGPICNLDCTYCYYLEKENLYAGSGRDFRMADDVLETYIRQYIQSQPAQQVSFAWQGGEPTLLGIPFFERVVELQKKHAAGKTIDNAFQTNGTLLNDEWGEFLARNKFLIGLSVDGPEEIHDTYRVDKGGQPTFARVMRGLGFLKKHGVEFNTLTVINRKNSYRAHEVYRFLKEIGSKYLQFIPIVEQVASQPDPNGLVLLKPYSRQQSAVSDWSVEPLQFGKFLQQVFDDWVFRMWAASSYRSSMSRWSPGTACRSRSASSSQLAAARLLSNTMAMCIPAITSFIRTTSSGTSCRRHWQAWWIHRNRRALAMQKKSGCPPIAVRAMCVSPATASAPSIASHKRRRASMGSITSALDTSTSSITSTRTCDSWQKS